uniref:DUF721 domain-containing protein n=1 Tax=Paulinella chromatophora TaxID=39717 RepID=B1X5D2_PAUCH|nr:hypothetical protein PCC_0736 [Paulinella chromatophora]ACB43151.1 hypothetical protein PCC_0736 [Paulinella chromatophora]
MEPKRILRANPVTSPNAISRCLSELKQTWKANANLAALWQDWNEIVGPQLALHCQPISLRDQVLTIGASDPQWRQALQYNRQKLIGSVKNWGFEIREVRIQQHYFNKIVGSRMNEELIIWDCHPSRADIHGMVNCPTCQSPAPTGEMARWGHCGFCKRSSF